MAEMVDRHAELFKALGVGSRIKIIELLKERGSLCVKDISDELGISPSAVSQHLKVLRFAGLVRNERKGYWIPYEVDEAAMAECHELLSEICRCGCSGHVQAVVIKREEIGGDDVETLRRYEQKLRAELERVEARLAELKEE